MLNLLYLPVGLALGYWIGWLYSNSKASQASNELKNQLSKAETENQLLKAQLEGLRATEDLLRMELNEVSLSNVRLETLLEENKKLTEQQQEQFEALSQKTLKRLKDELEEKANREYQQKQTQLDEKLSALLKPLREVIEQNEKKVREIEKQHTEDTASLKTHIEMIVAETGKLVGVKNKLAEALSNSKGRGDWGEMELIRLLEHSGLMPGVHYEAQKVQDGLRPDITIKLSNQRVLYVDAKTILINLERLLNAEDSEAENSERKKHAAALEKEILSLSLKAYETRCKESIDFVVLYVPRESMLRAALEERPALMEQAFQRRVILASPLILMSILKTVAYGWDQAQLSQKADEIHQLGKDLHKRAATFVERFLKVGDRLEALGKQFEEAKLSLDGRLGLVPQLRKFEEYGCKSEKTLPPPTAEESSQALLPEKNGKARQQQIVDVPASLLTLTE
ncbi:DNA recombination protein RmuC [Vampirovibrio chlorellavorus]|uniref:DNA recombination protein RmuC n=1 Tax=Vampirovibrio chlorellavorus TaxID=758823 RepID=UPI0026EB1A25|nr:DNA recombination protein RmuC [Vampirovibrio chlorellavorus]